jgi:hypothetical protein
LVLAVGVVKAVLARRRDSTQANRRLMETSLEKSFYYRR